MSVSLIYPRQQCIITYIHIHTKYLNTLSRSPEMSSPSFPPSLRINFGDGPSNGVPCLSSLSPSPSPSSFSGWCSIWGES